MVWCDEVFGGGGGKKMNHSSVWIGLVEGNGWGWKWEMGDGDGRWEMGGEVGKVGKVR